MGTFAYLFKEKGAAIPENKREEFLERIEMLFQAGGMMDLDQITLYGKTVTTLSKAQMYEDGMKFNYNYFEEDWWEPAGYDPKRDRVYSGKIGWAEFRSVMISAYTLEELYCKGITTVMLDGEPFASWTSVAWINYLFNEKYHLKNYDPWRLYEALHTAKEGDGYPLVFGEKGYLFIGACETHAVIYGIEDMINTFEKEEKAEKEERIFKNMKGIIEILQECREKDTYEVFMSLLKGLYTLSDEEDYSDLTSDQTHRLLLKKIYYSDAPAFAVKAIAEIYQKDFWELWEEIKGVARRKRQWVYGNEGYYILPRSTAERLHISVDDMIHYWVKNGELEFSEELKKWFKKLKEHYDKVINTKFVIEKPLLYIMELLEEADDNYYRIYAFTEFVEETMMYLYDKRYLALWKLFEEMIRDPKMKEAGDVLFVPDGPEYKNEGIFFQDTQPKRRLCKSWQFTPSEKKNNMARVTFRRYMALVANKELRREVFGF